MASAQSNSFLAEANVFQQTDDKQWSLCSSGFLIFSWASPAHSLRIIICPGTKDEYQYKLKAKIQSIEPKPQSFVFQTLTIGETKELTLKVTLQRGKRREAIQKLYQWGRFGQGLTANL